MMQRIRTEIEGHYYIATSYIEALDGCYETMVFEIKDREIDWEGIETRRTKNKYEAINHHITAISSYAKNA